MAESSLPVKPAAWALFDKIVRDAAASRPESPWRVVGEEPRFEPDFETLATLLKVPQFLDSKSTSGVPALAVDVWVASQFRRAGFASDSVWPRDEVPRVLPGSISRLLDGLGKSDAARLRTLLSTGKTFEGTVAANARILGKNYMKQVDVGISDWDTGPELLISTKRMDYSFGNNAPNRVEESYGDAKNLRSRHPLAALGFVFVLRSTAFTEAPDVAAWIVDLLIKLGREDDAYDSVTLLVPSYSSPQAGEATDDEETEGLVEAELVHAQDSDPGSTQSGLGIESLYKGLTNSAQVTLRRDLVPKQLGPESFFEAMVRRLLDNSPITRHRAARQLLTNAYME